MFHVVMKAVDPRYFGDFLFLTIYFATLYLFITFNYQIKETIITTNHSY